MKEAAMEAHVLDTPRGPAAYWLSRGSRDVTLVFLHGLLGDHRVFEDIPLPEGCNVLCWDAPAHGRSRPWDVFTYTYAAQALHEILQKEQLPHVVLIGQGFGAAVAQMYLRYYPAEGLIMLDPTVFGPFYSASQQRRIWRSQWLCVWYPKAHLTEKVLEKSWLPVSQLRRLKSADYSKKEVCRILTLGYVALLKENKPLPVPCPVSLILTRQDTAAEAWARAHSVSPCRTSDPGKVLREKIQKMI